MKLLTDRQEIALALNFGKYPVLYIDRDNRKYDSSDFAIGSKCKVSWDHKDPRYKDMSCRCEIAFSEGKYEFLQGGSCLHSEFGRQDVLEMVEWANVPTIHCGQEVIVVEDHSKGRMCYVKLMKVSERKNIHCMTVTTLEEVE